MPKTTPRLLKAGETSYHQHKDFRSRGCVDRSVVPDGCQQTFHYTRRLTPLHNESKSGPAFWPSLARLESDHKLFWIGNPALPVVGNSRFL